METYGEGREKGNRRLEDEKEEKRRDEGERVKREERKEREKRDQNVGKEGEWCVATLLDVCCCLVVFIMNNSGSKQLSPPYELKLVLKIS